MKKRLLSFVLILAMVLSIVPAMSITAWAEKPAEISYQYPVYNDDDATKGIKEWKTSTAACEVITDSDARVTWEAGWYVVSGTANLSKGADVSGNVHLILADGASLVINGVEQSNAGIAVTSPNSLTIYAQSAGKSMGVLTVAGGNNGAGIGGGYNKSGSNITINGGTVTATGGQYGAGIGGGDNGDGSNITINAGTIISTSPNGGAGIGGGNYGTGSSITINGGTITATGNGYFKGSCIGGGYGGDGSNIFINKDLILKADNNNPPTTVIENNGTDDLATSLAGVRYVTIELGPVSYENYTDGAFATATCTDYTIVSNSNEAVTWEAGWYVVNGNITISGGAVVNGEVHLILADDCYLTIAGVTEKNAGLRAPGGMCSLTVYGQKNGTGKLNVTGGNNGAGIGGISGFDGSSITINGGTIVANGGSGGAGIGSGQYGEASNITINGGTITAKGGDGGSGIGGGQYGDASDITINGGRITAIGGSNGAGIGGGQFESYMSVGGKGENITINGGTITAKGGTNADAIGKGCGGSSSNIFVNKSIVKAGASEDPTDVIDFEEGEDVASKLTGKQYATVSLKPNYLTFTAEQANSTIKLKKDGTPAQPRLQYSTDGAIWTNFDIENGVTLPNVGDKILLKAETTNSTISVSDKTYYYFSMTGKIAASGDVTSLLNGVGGDTTLTPYAFYKLFDNCTSLTTAPELPATTLADYCYSNMFAGCTSLSTAPRLSATKLANQCYSNMFKDCSKLKIKAGSETNYAWRIPNAGTAQNTVDDMVSGTAIGSVTVLTPDSGYNYYRVTNTIVCENTNTSTSYASIQTAINEATSGDTIKLVEDAIENISIPENKSIILDLNDKVLEGDGTSSVITNNGTLTIKDSNPSSVHYFEYATQAAWTLTGASVNAIGVDQITSTTALGTIIKVSGGCITGGTGNTFFGEKVGGGIFNDGSLSIKGCNIIGNTAVRGGATYITMNNKSLVIDGTMIAGNTSSNVGAGVYIHNDSSFRMIDGTIRNNSVTGGYGGGGVYIRGSFTMEDGEISNNYAKSGTGVYVYYNDHGAPNTPGAFAMSAGAIKNNSATDKGGGVYVDDHADVLICGTITGNTAGSLGGGVCCNSPITVGKTSNITDNKVSNNDSNVALRHDGKAGSIEISTEQPLENGACIGVSYLDSNKKTTIGAFTGNNSVDYSEYFTSDDSAFEVRYIKSGAGNKLVLGKLPAVCEITSGGGLEGNKYSTLTEALATINDGEIKLLADTTESITIQSNQNITLDLNNYVLKANTANRVILNWGKLNLVDTAETKTIKYFTDSNSDHSFDRLETSYSTASKIEGTDYVAVTGGSVVGGHLLEQNSCGSGVFNNDTLVLNGVNVVGNIATYGGAVANFGTMTIINSNLVGNYAMNGGAVYNAAAGVLAMTSGNLYTNTAQNYGGGVYNINEFTMNGGSIENCKTLDVSYGVGAGVMNTYKFTMNGGTIDSCQSAYAAGGVFSDGSVANNGHETSTFFTMTGGEIKACNTARAEHLDESLYIKNSTMSISGGKVQGTIFPNNNTNGGIDLECNISITGGYFNKNFPSDKNWIPSGYAKTNTTAVSGYTYYVAKERRTTNGGGTPSIPFYNISANAVVNGTVSVSNANANSGNTVTITVKPADKYELDTLTVVDAQGNAVAVTTVTEGKTYTFVIGTSDVQVSATFKAVKKEKIEEPVVNPFTDISTEDYYYDSVMWALKNKITSGVSEVEFAPLSITTRVQMVTFLWRAAGCPEADGEIPFKDVDQNEYYADAVRWAVSKGITNGISATEFGIEANVTRAQTVTFLWRFENAPKAAATAEFKDVDSKEYYADAVAWANEKNITNGTTKTTFGPEESCTRGQVVTFLYRDIVK